MPRLKVIGDDGTVQEVSVTDSNTSIVVEEDNEEIEFTPAVVERVEFDGDPDMSTISTTCGEKENRRESETKGDITIEAIITKSQLQDAKNLGRGDNITLISDVHNAEVIVNRISIEQRSELVSYVPDGGVSELAFGLQLQLKEP